MPSMQLLNVTFCGVYLCLLVHSVLCQQLCLGSAGSTQVVILGIKNSLIPIWSSGVDCPYRDRYCLSVVTMAGEMVIVDILKMLV